uniref:Uncharacterized protein n=1 Tax=Anopheles quadriannulatus TaxID=34691 RepID=A0A182XRN4_ANOQN
MRSPAIRQTLGRSLSFSPNVYRPVRDL